MTLNETLEKAIAASGGALPPGIELVLRGHIHLWEVIGFRDNRPPQFVLGSGSTELAHPIKDRLTGLRIAETVVSFRQSEHLWGFIRFVPAAAGAWTATLGDEKGRPRAGCTVARGEISCK